MILTFVLVALVLMNNAAALPGTTITLIRKVGNNYLFRGPEQTLLGRWADEALRLQMRLLAPSIPHNFYLVDLCLLNQPQDEKDEAIEENYFKGHPEKGVFVPWPTNGTKHDVYNYSLPAAAAAVREWRNNTSWIDALPWWIDEIEGLLQTPRTDNRSTAIYVHCQAGKDRTGEVSGSYYMRYMNMTLQEATTLDRKIAGRPIHYTNQLALEWYCVYLREVLNYSLECPKPSQVPRIRHQERGSGVHAVGQGVHLGE